MATPVEQEREVRELIRRADRTAVPTNHVRKDTLKRLIELAHSLHPPLKKIAANNIARFFKDFPDLDEDAINAIYDLCEDQDPQIRIDGYNAIVQMSREQTKWVKRNADVLVQLLQSDEPEEVAVVKIALSEHLEMDSKVALGVLCDQIVPPDDPMDEEDGAIRERLRSLVVAFMASEARQAIIERHASQAGSEQEKIVINGLFKAVSKFGRTDATRIIKDILIYLPSFSGRSTPRGNELLHIVLEQARSSLKGDLATATTASLNLTGYFLDLAGYLAIEKGVSDPAQLLRFYCTSSILGKMTLQRLSRDAHLFVVVRTAEALRVCSVGKSPDKGDTAAMRRQIVDACAILLPFFVKAKPSDVRVWIACEILLSACQQRKDEESWNASSAFITTLEEIGRLASEQKGLKLDRVQGLIRVRLGLSFSFFLYVRPYFLPSLSSH
ncbi:hypothetical protein BV25DRAFT_1862609 [Artomyces pyxidatus]|uniref:Uncharacterized protein n=1 Tax=Artomyces pyxidatus TaxID=48021 RepID=A0ACB8SNS0_9AGAM|nr:hypothetical protein BV25DRAFT_1862609 [Artomyces pyxidatus]